MPVFVSPSVGSKQQVGNKIEFSVRGRSFGIVLAGFRIHAPGKIGIAGAALMLHIFFCPSPQPVENILFVQLHGHHHAVGKSFGAGIVVFQVGNIGHGIADFEIHPVRPFKYIVIGLGQFGINLGLAISGFPKNIPVFACFPGALFPWLHFSAGIVERLCCNRCRFSRRRRREVRKSERVEIN